MSSEKPPLGHAFVGEHETCTRLGYSSFERCGQPRSAHEPAPPPQEPSSEALELAHAVTDAYDTMGNWDEVVAARLIDAWAAQREKCRGCDEALGDEAYCAADWRLLEQRAEAAEKVIADLRTEAGRAAFATSNNWPLPEELRAAEARAAHYEELLEAALMSVLEDGDYLYKEITEALRR